MNKKSVQKFVIEAYGNIARNQEACGCSNLGTKEFAKSVGYSEEELKIIPDDANMALSCGNPTALANLKEGEIVLDLGSGAGFDCFLAATKVGAEGRVIGIDMTPEMIEKAGGIAKRNKIENVDFRLGEIENLPVADNSVDVVISNCVINLATNKSRVFQEIQRILRPKGRIAISDIATVKELPKKIQENMEAYAGCIAGAISVDNYKKIVEAAGFKDVKITAKATSACIGPNTADPIGKAVLDNLDNRFLENYIVSVYVEGRKGE